MDWKKIQVAERLQKIAAGEGFYEQALFVARHYPETTEAEAECLYRWSEGRARTLADTLMLQDIANKIDRIGRS